MVRCPPARVACLLTVLAVCQPAAQDASSFRFTPADLRLLEQADLADKRLEREGVVYRDSAVDLLLVHAAERLLQRQPPPQRVTWHFKVLRSPAPNAFALPNGSVYIYSGLLAALRSDAQLAAVLAHEISHVVKRHSFARLRSSRRATAALNATRTALAAAASAATSPYDNGRAVLSVLGGTPGLWSVAMEGYGRDAEREADTEAQTALTGGGYAPSALAEVLEAITASVDRDRSEPAFWASPRQTEERLSDLKAKPTTSQTLASTPPSDTAYLVAIENLIRHNAQLAIDFGNPRSAVVDLQRLVDGLPPRTENLFSLAEAYRALGPRPLAGDRSPASQRTAALTPEEEERALMGTALGVAAFNANRATAEALYRRALALDPANHRVHRGLGFLYERAGEIEAARRAFREYLRAAPAADDRAQIEHRLQQLEPEGSR